MKTVLDAVIEFKGVLPVEVSPPWYFGQNESGFSTYIGFDNRKACAIDEFNALVDELASNFGKCDISYQKHCSNEVTRLEGDEMKTVTHEGKVIQIGAVYELSDDGKDWELKVLTEVSDSAWPFFSGDERFSHIRECKASIIGTVTEAPVELVDGECYQFTAPSGIVRKGYFIPVKRLFVCADGNIDVDRCTNIKLLTVEK